MKFCLHSRLPKEYLQKADQIKILYRDIASTPDVIAKYPDKDIIIDIYGSLANKNCLVTWEQLTEWRILSRDKLILCFTNFEDFKLAKTQNFRAYIGFEIDLLNEYLSLIDAGAEYIRIGEGLFFTLSQLSERNLLILEKNRIVPNISYFGYSRKNGVSGKWIRPEDVEFYEPFISVFEFEDATPTQEAAFYRLYAERKHWAGELYLIIKNLNYPGLNRLLSFELGGLSARLNCRQSCISGGNCRICYRALDIANSKDKIEQYKKKIQENKQDE